MKRKALRLMGILFGAWLGLYVGGLWGNNVIVAESGQDHHGHDHSADSSDHDGHDHGDHSGPHAADLLKPGENDAPWYSSVLVIAGGLFVAAVLLGIPAMKLKGPEPPDPADDHHGHDDHGHGDHDDHGHGH